MKTLTIFNMSNRPRTFELPHQEVCCKIGRCLCHANGAPRTILFAAKRSPHRGIPEYVLLSVRLRAAVDAGELRVFEEHEGEPSRKAGTAKDTSTKTRKKKR